MAKIFLSFYNPVLDEYNSAAPVFNFGGLGKIPDRPLEVLKRFAPDYSL